MSGKRLAATLLTAAFVATCIGLGMWQLGRLGDVRAQNATTLERGSLPVADVERVLDEGAPEEIVYRRVRARGTFDAARDMRTRSSAYRGLSGHRIVSALRLEDGSGILVDRGWAPLGTEPEEVAPPPGEVIVTGVLVPSQERKRFGPPEDEELDEIVRIDVDAVSRRFPFAIAPVYVQLVSLEPAAQTEHPIPVPIDRLDEGPHLSYAVQWFLFGAGALVGYAALFRRSRRQAAS